MSVRRRDKRVWFVVFGVFVAVFLFTFLTQKFKDNEDADAANLANFDPGYIISDYQMSNYNSMSEADIQRFLTAKNPCNNRDYNSYTYLTNRYPGYSWHWANGHFVCISEERFGDGEVIGSGDTAARIIWQAAQDYKINPQVLIVLLQKEQGLITDDYPNSRQYRAATGYGCPDTAACSSQYYGFKNQVRKAAALFRAVLDGGWTNYPLGNNYIQYNPNAACGGSVVNVRSLATSALYRYTPYQPNGSALAAGYGIGDGCGAYGNRNFYLYFEDWFGGATGEEFISLDTPRYMIANRDIERINPSTGKPAGESIIKKGQIVYYSTKVILSNGACLRTKHNTENNIRACAPVDYLEEIKFDFRPDKSDRYLVINKGNKKINFRTDTAVMKTNNAIVRKCAGEVTFLGKTYYITEFDTRDISKIESGFLKDSSIREYGRYTIYNTARPGVITKDTFKKDLINDTFNLNVKLVKGQYVQFLGEIIDGGKKYYITKYDILNDNAIGVLADEVIFYEKLKDEETIILNKEATRFEPITETLYDKLENGRTLTVASYIVLNNKKYYRTKYNTDYDMNVVLDIE